jgi:Asp-tRNA(Asn)/Glu-tRNA(Gln) amidotransferase A subunit family amidase
MIELPKGRIRGRALEMVVTAVKRTPARHVVARILRKELGIDAARALGPDARGDQPFSHAPLQARRDQSRPSQNLGAPRPAEWPRSAHTLGTALRENQVTPSQLAERAYAHARSLAGRSPSLGPILDYDEENAFRAARESEARWQSGRALGALDGIPVLIKEEICVKGQPVRVGTGWMPNTPARTDACAVARLREAGAIILGTTPMTEYGMSPLGGNVHRKMPRNAHQTDRLPGGSSTGSAVAVATGIVPVALGLDGGGSIRIPAAHNGVFGLKPTFGRVPATGHGVAGGSSVVHLGPIGSSTTDLAEFLEITAGPDAGDPSSLGQPAIARGSLLEALGRGVKGLRIGIDEDDWASADPVVAKAARNALDSLIKDGAELVPVSIGLAKHSTAIGYLTIGIEFFTNLSDVRKKHLDELGLDLQMLLVNISTFSPDDYLDGQRLRSELRRQVQSTLGKVDVLALPTTASPAAPVTEADEREGFVDPAALDASCRYAFIGNLTGVPAGSAPVGKDADGVPLGLQIIGDAWDEACVLAVLAHLERTGAAKNQRPRSAIDLLER